MSRSFCWMSLSIFLLFLTTRMTRASDVEPSWQQWRGPLGTGVAPNANPPIEWSETKNVRWKTAIPGKVPKSCCQHRLTVTRAVRG